MKKGSILIAIDPCVMTESQEPALTVGKEYIILHRRRTSNEYKPYAENAICVINDQGDEHWFTLDSLDYFFMAKN